MALPPVLTRFDTHFYKPKSGSNTARVPATPATIKFFRQGATAKSAASVPYVSPEEPDPPPPTALPVWNLGSIAINDTLQVDTSTSSVIWVQDIDVSDPSNPILLVYNAAQPSGIFVASGARLLRKTASAIVYKDPTGKGAGAPAATDTLSTDTTGRAEGYIAAYRYDFTVTGTGLTAAVYADYVGSYIARS